MARSRVIRPFPSIKKLWANGIPNLENLINLQLMQEKEYVLMAFPRLLHRRRTSFVL